MIRCQRCSTENLDGSQYCDECGALLGGNGSNAGQPLPQQSSPQPQQVATAVTPTPPRIPETRDDYVADKNFGLKTNVAARPLSSSSSSSSGSADDHRPPSLGAATALAHPSASSESSPPSPHGAANRGSNNSPKVGGGSKLIIQRGRSTGKEFSLENDEIYIGRWDADGGIFPDIDLDTDDPEAKVSRRHARITQRDGQFYIEDLGSTNGTFINRGRRLIPGDRQQIYDGDEIIVGKTFMRFSTVGREHGDN